MEIFPFLLRYLFGNLLTSEHLDVDVALGIFLDIDEEGVEARDCGVDVVVELWTVH